jgi:hypothetical protein
MPSRAYSQIKRRPRPKRPKKSLTRPRPAFKGTIAPARPGGRKPMQSASSASDRQKQKLGMALQRKRMAS